MLDNLKGNSPRGGLSRWIQVISLGCSIGLLTVFVVLNVRQHLLPPRQDLAPEEMELMRDARFVVSSKPTGDELSRLVRAQLAAFRAEDYTNAYALAAEEMKSQIPLPAFERMVKIHYPAIASSTSANFGVMVDNGEQAIVNVDITSSRGTTGHYQYILHHEGKGWKISGVTELQSHSTVI